MLSKLCCRCLLVGFALLVQPFPTLADCIEFPFSGSTQLVSDWQYARLKREAERATTENAEFVAWLAEDYAASHAGEYPAYAAALMQHWSASGGLLLNPFYCAAIDPVDGQAAIPGQIGYLPLVSSSGNTTGAVISAFGANATLKIIVLPFGAPD